MAFFCRSHFISCTEVAMPCKQVGMQGSADCPQTGNLVLLIGNKQTPQCSLATTQTHNAIQLMSVTLPKPMTAKVLPTRDTPVYSDLFHSPRFTEASAWATFLLRAQIKAMPCSAAATVFAVGAFTTKHPYCTYIEHHDSTILDGELAGPKSI